MKKLYILFFLLLFSFSAFSQDGLQERAKKLSDEMTVVLSLDNETSEKIYHIQLKRFIDAQKIRKVHQSDKRQMKAELRKLQNRLWGRLKGILGDEKMKSWSMHKKSI
jgi:hypothetical protein